MEMFPKGPAPPSGSQSLLLRELGLTYFPWSWSELRLLT